MNTNKIIKISSAIVMSISILGILSVSLMAFQSPQAVMDLVKVKLENTDALSSIRGIYGGVGIPLIFIMIYFWRTNMKIGMLFLGLFWGSYAISRMLTIIIDGPLGAFGTQWIYTESILAILAFILFAKSEKA